MKVVKGWLLPAATNVSAGAVGQVLNGSPWRRHGKRDTWIGQKGDPMTTAPANDPWAFAVAVTMMLAMDLRAARWGRRAADAASSGLNRQAPQLGGVGDQVQRGDAAARDGEPDYRDRLVARAEQGACLAVDQYRLG